MIHCPCGHERYGYVFKDGVLAKNVERSRHLFRKQNAWGIQADVLDYHAAQLTYILIRDIQNNVVYLAGKETFLRYREGPEVISKKFGLQYWMRLGYWTRKTIAPTELHQPRLI